MKNTADLFHARRAIIYAEKHASGVVQNIMDEHADYPDDEFATAFIAAVTIFAANMLAKSAMSATDCHKPHARELVRAALKNLPMIVEETIAVIEVKE